MTMNGQEITIHENEMTSDMEARTVGHAVASFDKFGGDSAKVAESLKTFMDTEFKSSWEVIVGKQFDAKITHLKGSYIRFSYLDHMVVIMRLVCFFSFLIKNYLSLMMNYLLAKLRFNFSRGTHKESPTK